MPEPWGHKLTIHVYVEGDISRAADVSDFYASLAPEPEPDFVGIGISEVAERPVDQGSRDTGGRNDRDMSEQERGDLKWWGDAHRRRSGE